MIWSVAEQIAQLSKAFELKAGDIIYSGTPENVGPVVVGDTMLCKIDGLTESDFFLAAKVDRAPPRCDRRELGEQLRFEGGPSMVRPYRQASRHVSALHRRRGDPRAGVEWGPLRARSPPRRRARSRQSSRR